MIDLRGVGERRDKCERQAGGERAEGSVAMSLL